MRGSRVFSNPVTYMFIHVMIHAYLHFCTDYYTNSVFVIPYEALLLDMCDTFLLKYHLKTIIISSVVNSKIRAKFTCSYSYKIFS